MIPITPQMRILLAIEPVDFRRGIDGLPALCRAELKSDPFSGAVFVFRSRSAKAVKVLFCDSQGFWLAQKRLSQGRLRWWPTGDGEPTRPLEAHELQVLLWNGNPSLLKVGPAWRRLAWGS